MSAADEELPGQEQLEFFDGVWGNETAYVQFVQKRQDERGKRTGDPTDAKWFKWPMERARIGRWIDSRLEDTLYFAVPGYDATKRQSDHFKWQRAIYVDDDGVSVPYRIEPTYYVISSPGHAHAYWLLDKIYPKLDTQKIGRDISQLHKHDNEFHEDLLIADKEAGRAPHKFCGTDPGGWDSTQILRVPGSINNKPEYGEGFEFRVHVEPGSGKVYTLAEMQEAYPDTGQPLYEPPSPDSLPDMPDHVSLLAKLSGRSDLVDLYTEKPTGRGNSRGWDERLFALENELFRLGFKAQEVYALCWHAACNKFLRGVRVGDTETFTPRPNPQLDLWRDVLKAQALHDDPNRVAWQAPGYDRDSIMNLEVEPRQEKQKYHISLLTAEERERADKHRTFIDTYVEWASSKTDAALVYHEACAFTILSTVLGEFGHAFPKFGKLRLNLWFLVMGQTTRSRKSTSRGLMMKVIEGMMEERFNYDEGSDFTSEGLIDVLLQKDRRSSLIHKDEVQGMFKNILSKSYMSDLSDTLTELYDGKVGGKTRAGGNSHAAAETNFVLFAMGIVKKITSVLTLDDFQTGFLARFLHVIGESPERTRETEWLDQASPSEVASGDPRYIDILADLATARTFWLNESPAFFTVPIMFEDDAWARWNEANWDLQESIVEHERAEVLEAAVDRMGKSAIKAAALIAMYNMRDRVTLDDVLVALKYTSVWATHMVQSAEMISETFFKKDMRTLHDIVIAKGGEIKWEEAYSKMDKDPGQFKNVVEGAVMSAMVAVKIDDATKVRWLVSL